MVQSQVEIPIVCENEKCKNYGELINLVREIRYEEIDVFYENYGHPADEDDYCPICDRLGVAEDAYLD